MEWHNMWLYMWFVITWSLILSNNWVIVLNVCSISSQHNDDNDHNLYMWFVITWSLTLSNDWVIVLNVCISSQQNDDNDHNRLLVDDFFYHDGHGWRLLMIEWLLI